MGRVEAGTLLYDPMPIVGYCDRSSVRAGERIQFFVSLRGAVRYRSDLVRLICGDTNIAGPGVKEQVVASPINCERDGVERFAKAGSYGVVSEYANAESGADLTVAAYIYPTRLGKRQAILTQWNESVREGWSLEIDPDGYLTMRVGQSGKTASLRSPQPLVEGVWYRVAAVNAASEGALRLFQEPMVNSYNGRLRFVQGDAEAQYVELQTDVNPPGNNSNPLLFAAWTSGGQDSDADGCFNGKIEAPRISDVPLDVHTVFDMSPTSFRGAWDFASSISDGRWATPDTFSDASGHGFDGRFVNLPMSAVTGCCWDGTEYDFRHAPNQYAAVHFHEDDLSDAKWDVDFSLDVDTSIASGVYAVRLRATVEGVDEEDYIPFVVRPQLGRPTSKLAFLLPTCTYLAYANDNMAADSEDAVVLENTIGSAPVMGKEDLARQIHREYGSSLYDTHSDGSGVCYSSWRRPILNVRPKYRHTLSNIWQFNADLHLVDWCEARGIAIDVVTDQDLDEDGAALLEPYNAVFTGTHPEYCTGAMLDALEHYVTHGGRIAYLGGNGFYWVGAFHPTDRQIFEVRKWGGTEAWTAAPGERFLSFSGELGGLWRNRNRAPQKLVGVGFIAQGLDVSTYFRRNRDSYDDEARWIFDGVEEDELVGDFGLEGGGAAGMEIDSYDPRLGSPGDAYVVASSENHTSLMLEVRENYGITQPFLGGTVNARVRADMIYFRLPGGGAVFSTGSIAWCGSLAHNNYSNNVSQITENVLRAFGADGDLPRTDDRSAVKEEDCVE